jgi:hypothetical protein
VIALFFAQRIPRTQPGRAVASAGVAADGA